MSGEWVFWLLSAVAVLGALAVVLVREMIRMIAGLAAFLIAVAAMFLYFRMPFLAASQVFVYVGGVLVMMLFAVMIIRRDTEGRPKLTSRYDLVAFVLSVGVAWLIWWALSASAPSLEPIAGGDPVGDLGGALLGDMLVHFEFLGVMLLAALVAVLAIVGGRRES